MMINTRPENPDDMHAIRRVHELAFQRKSEADLMDALRDSGDFIISLVAVQDDQVVGHVLFSPVVIRNEKSASTAMGLGPLAVLPAYQRKGIGSKLVTQGLQACKTNGYPIVVVLGHPAYYPRFGFTPSKPLGITCEGEAPEEAFMVVELEEGALKGVSGVVSYPGFQKCLKSPRPVGDGRININCHAEIVAHRDASLLSGFGVIRWPSVKKQLSSLRPSA
jgi:putative acetyltransferase